MVFQPCVECGELSDKNRCDRHRLKRGPKTNTSHIAYKNDAKWKKLSKRLRKMSPHCELCGTSDDLTVDHIVRVVDRPDWAYEIDNCRILCRYHNGKLALISATPEVERDIERKIAESKARRLRRRGDVLQTGDAFRPLGKALTPSHIVRQD